MGSSLSAITTACGSGPVASGINDVLAVASSPAATTITPSFSSSAGVDGIARRDVPGRPGVAIRS